jgi:hypothetical protein
MNAASEITKERLKSEIDKVSEEYLSVLYRIILALEEPGKGQSGRAKRAQADQASWSRFVAEMYGSTADAPLDRAAQGQPDSRLKLE